jgi:hypothetical protein
MKPLSNRCIKESLMRLSLGRPSFALIACLMVVPPALSLEPLPDQVDPAASELPMLSDPGTAAPAPAGQTDNDLPPLPGETASQAAPSNDAALPPLPGDTAPAASQEALPPLPGQEPAAAPAQPAAQAASTQPTPAETMPPLPGQEPAPTPEVKAKSAAKPQKEARPWEATKKRANAILGGWVRAKGGNESSRIAWASQGALHALVFHGYKVLDEKGLYEGQAGAQGNQWRLITFEVPKAKRTLEVYVTDVKGRVWMRVGPSEPPPFSVHSIGQVKAIRSDSLKALAHIRKQMGKRLRPHRGKSWEAPYSFALASADHH